MPDFFSFVHLSISRDLKKENYSEQFGTSILLLFGSAVMSICHSCLGRTYVSSIFLEEWSAASHWSEGSEFDTTVQVQNWQNIPTLEYSYHLISVWAWCTAMSFSVLYISDFYYWQKPQTWFHQKIEFSSHPLWNADMSKPTQSIWTCFPFPRSDLEALLIC